MSLRFWFPPLVLVLASCVALDVASGAKESSSSGADPTRRTKETRQREGTRLVDQVGRFQLSMDRTLFLPTDARDQGAYRVLESLALERVLENLNESRTDRVWTVSGVIYEFRGANYLLLTRATLQPNAPAAPEEVVPKVRPAK